MPGLPEIGDQHGRNILSELPQTWLGAVSNRNLLDRIPGDPLLPPVVKPGGVWIGVACEVLDVFESDTLRQQIGDCHDAERMRRELVGRFGIAQPAFDHAADVGGATVMATIYKRNKRKKNEPYSIQYLDHAGNRRTTQGFTDRGLTEQLAAKLETDARMRRTGLIDPDQERFVERKQSPIAEHLKALEESLGDNTGKHVKLTMFRVRRIIEGCEFQNLGDIESETVQTFLRQLCTADDLGHRTYNHYLQAIDAFLNWCVPKRLLSNPLAGLERLNQEVDVRHKRRALTADEVGTLVASARSSVVCLQRFNGEQRARIYIVSYMTGLRRSELASLSPRSFDLKADPPTLTVEAAASKHRRKDVLPLHPELVVMLRQWFKGLAPGQKLFPNLERKKTWFMVKKDLERVGIPYETEDGIADFHGAGRHSHITELLRNGTSLPEAKELARHSDVKMTMKYAHIGITDQAKAVAKLPAPCKADNAALHGRCISGGVECHSPSSSGKSDDSHKSETPCGDRGFGVERRHLAKGGKVEAGGHQ